MGESTIGLHSPFGAGEVAHLARLTLGTRRPSALFTRGAPQLLWVQNGAVRMHGPDGRDDLAEGDLVFLQPATRAAFQGRGAAPMVVAVSFDAELIEQLVRRHPDLGGLFFWTADASAGRAHRDVSALARLNQAALRLERGRRDALGAEAFLLPLCLDLLETAETARGDAPDWLSRAMAAAREPDVFRDGAAGLARVAGRAHPHVARMMRRFTGLTPSDYVNAQRMAFAARRLTGTEDSLAEIAAECGIPNLSHFHKLFRSHHGQTPAQFRRARQRDVIHPPG